MSKSGNTGSKEVTQGYDVGIPGLPRRRRPMTMMPYKPRFAQMVSKLKKRATFEFTKLVEQLKAIEEMVRVDTFIYENEKDALEGKRALLTLWQQLMELAEVVPAYRQNLFYSMIFFIVTRYFFSQIYFLVFNCSVEDTNLILYILLLLQSQPKKLEKQKRTSKEMNLSRLQLVK